MSLLTPGKFSLRLALLTTVAFAAVWAVLNIFLLQTEWWVLGILAAATYLISLILSWTMLKRFLYNRIKIIYKTIRQKKIPKGTGDLKSRINEPNVLDEVEVEVYEWVKAKNLEIDELKKQEQFRREFIGNLSHELKTPIFNIQGYLLTLLDGGLEDKSVNRQYLMRAEKSINRMVDIITDLETIARLDSGEQKLAPGKFDIHALTHEVFELYEMKAAEKKIKLTFSSASNRVVHVLGDREKIRQVLSNLVENSIKYGKSEGVTKVSFFDMDEHILVEMTDNGIGISSNELPRVFERFYRTGSGRVAESGGSGLGLSIVKHIIEAHDQTINVRSTIGIGTTFSFTLEKA
jgi:two-component system, OmpR family, phosphate regulon sensor histidine kinase PhoR